MTTDLKVAARDSRLRTRIWDARSGRLIEDRKDSWESGEPLGLASPDGRWEAVDWPGCLAIHDARTGKIAFRTRVDLPGLIWSWSPDGRRLLVRTTGVWKASDGLWIWSPFDGEEPRILDSYFSDMHFSLTGAAWSPDSRTVVSAAEWGLGFFDARSGNLLVRYEERPRITSVAWSSRGVLALKFLRGRIRLITPADRFPTKEHVARGGAQVSIDGEGELAWSPDGAVLAISDGASLRFLDVETLRELPTRVQGCDAFTFFPQGHFVAAGLEDNTVLLLDPFRESRGLFSAAPPGSKPASSVD